MRHFNEFGRRKMRVAVIGLGVVGQVHIKVIQETKSELVAVCDTDVEKLKSYAGIKGYTDYLSMLNEVKPDVVHICTPHYLHAEMVIECLKRDINVLCEKPLCIRKEEIPLILEAEKNSKAQLGVCFQNRYNPSTVFAKKYLRGKQIVSAHARLMWRRDKEYYSQAGWRGKKAQEGGSVLINQALHTVDLLQYFLGMPKTVIGWCGNLSLQGIIDTEDTATVICRGDKEYSLLASNTALKNNPVEIIIKTEQDVVRIFANGVYINGEFYDCKTLNPVYGKEVYGSGHCELIRDFYDCIGTGKKFPIDGNEGLKAVKIVLAAYESQGEEVLCK